MECGFIDHLMALYMECGFVDGVIYGRRDVWSVGSWMV